MDTALYVAITDRDWYEQLRSEGPDEVNFWRPGGKQAFRAVPPGGPFLFKLHYPAHAIVGGGWFVRFAFLPMSVAWMAFGRKNGVDGLDAFSARIHGYRRSPPQPDPVIGCIVLTDPFFFESDAWIEPPRDWPRNTVQGKGYDLTQGEGARLWVEVTERLRDPRATTRGLQAPSPLASREERWRRIRTRLGQGGFRASVTDAYSYRCAVTGERTLPVLEAAHIRPHAREGPNDVRNGLLLRSDLHILFDRGFMTVDPRHRVLVSSRIREEFENGREYYRFDGQQLANLPRPRGERPEESFLAWHNEHVFEAGPERDVAQHS